MEWIYDDVDRITKVTQVFPRADGSEVRVTATACPGIGLEASVGLYAHRRLSPAHPWVLLKDQLHPDWRAMSVDEYCKRGRSELLQHVTLAERVRVCQYLGQPVSVLH